MGDDKGGAYDAKISELANSIATLSVEIETLKKAGSDKAEIASLKSELKGLQDSLVGYQKINKAPPIKLGGTDADESRALSGGFFDPGLHE